MDEIFGRVTAILFAAAVFMGMPLVYMSERAKSAEQMYLLTVNTEFVDSICNTGFLTMEMYQQFYKEISAASGIYEVHMYREQKDIVLEQGDYSYESIFFDEKDMLAELEKNRVYEFERGLSESGDHKEEGMDGFRGKQGFFGQCFIWRHSTV